MTVSVKQGLVNEVASASTGELDSSSQYNNAISQHYAAYRPPLHELLLARYFADDMLFSLGLDIGCGTGVSTQALKPYCERIYAVDPSAEMISKARPCEGLTYVVGDGESLALADRSVAVVTFAGSLNYAKSTALVAELERVCQANATVVVYDFEILLDTWLEALGTAISAQESDYDHAINFNDFSQLAPLCIEQQPMTLSMDSNQLAHVLFSSTRRYAALERHFSGHNAFDAVVSALEVLREQNGAESHAVIAQTYLASYQINLIEQ